jgi:hypothetical protein
VDANLVAALVMALGRAIQRLLRPARPRAALVIGTAGGLSFANIRPLARSTS